MMNDKTTKVHLYRPFVSNGIISVEPLAFYLSEKLALAHGQMLIDSGEVEDSLLGEWQTSADEYTIKIPQQFHDSSLLEILESEVVQVVLYAADAEFTENVTCSVLNVNQAKKEVADFFVTCEKLGLTVSEEFDKHKYKLTNPETGHTVYLQRAPVVIRDLYSFLGKDIPKEAYYNYSEKEPMDVQLSEIIRLCSNLDAGERLDVRNFGCYGELDLHITKDSSYHREVDEDYNNLVTISTCWRGKWVDDTGDIYVTDGSLWDELARIFHYKDFSKDKEETER